MSLNLYFLDELNALRQAGRRFSERNPALAPFLGQRGQDPDIERLLEGVAFLTGRLRQKLDDELPELTHSLMHLLWPNFMRPVPAVTLAQFSTADSYARIERGLEVRSKEVAGAFCRFRTIYPVDISPLEIEQLDYIVGGASTMFKLRLSTGSSGLTECALDSLRLCFADSIAGKELFRALMTQLKAARLTLLTSSGAELASSALPVDCVGVVGFDEQEALFPYPQNAFRGYRLLQEYFAYEQKFMFVDVLGMNALHRFPEAELAQASDFELCFELAGPAGHGVRPVREDVLLRCTPLVNLFNADGHPVRPDGRSNSLEVGLKYEAHSQTKVFSVDRVYATAPGGAGEVEFVSFESFRHNGNARDGQQASVPYYSTYLTPTADTGGFATYLRLNRSGSGIGVVSTELTCTDGDLPSQLGAGAVCEYSQGSELAPFKNLTIVTPGYAPPLHTDFLWNVISSMSLNYVSLANLGALRAILETYDFPRYYRPEAKRLSEARLAALTDIRHCHVDRLHRGLPIRGIRTELKADPAGFGGEGGLYLFGCVLNEFFALYASLNSFHELCLHSTQGEVYQWKPRMGQQPLL